MLKIGESGNYIICKGPKDIDTVFEKSLLLFFSTSFHSKEVYMVTPWISTFEFRSQKLIYYPYVSSAKVLDILMALARNGVKVSIATRCFDFLDYDLLYLVFTVTNYGTTAEIKHYIQENLEDIIRRAEALLELSKVKNINVRFDLEQRLHSKIYINDFMAIMGSLNFTYSAMFRNYECINIIYKDKDVNSYNYLRKYSEELFQHLLEYSTCEKAILDRLAKVVNVKFSSVKEMLDALREDILRRL
jgi:phosphatidylserine/phosphatidylglycerophosphate/cardiolipin synthase-like enzyme